MNATLRRTGRRIKKAIARVGRVLANPGEALVELEANLHAARKGRLRTVPNVLPHPRKRDGESLAIPGCVQLDSYSCGAAAGWMVLKALHPRADFSEFYLRCSPKPRKGMQDGKLVKALRASGVGISTRKDGINFAAIKKAIGDGFPIITIIDRPGTFYAHWVVIYGYSQPRRTRQKLVYVAGNNLFGIHAPDHGGPNPLPYREFARLSDEFPAYVCWGKK